MALISAVSEETRQRAFLIQMLHERLERCHFLLQGTTREDERQLLRRAIFSDFLDLSAAIGPETAASVLKQLQKRSS